MPILGQPDTSIYGQTQLWNAPGLAPQGRAGGQAGPTAAQMKFAADQQTEQDINALAQQYGDDYDGFVNAVSQKYGDKGYAAGKALEDWRKTGAERYKAQSEASSAGIEAGLKLLQGADETNIGERVDMILKDNPRLAPVLTPLKTNFTPDGLQAVQQIGQNQKEFWDWQARAGDAILSGDKMKGLAAAYAGASSPDQRAIVDRTLKLGGYGKLVGLYPDQQSAQTAFQQMDALKPEKAESAGSDLKQYLTKWAGEHGKTYDQMTTADVDAANTQREKTMRKPVVAGGSRSGVGGPELVIKPNTRDYRIATDVASGRLPYGDFQRMFGRGAQFAEKKAAMYDTARQINPDFDVAAFEMGQKVAGNPKIVMQVSSLNNVMSGVPDLLKASDAASNAGVRLLNSYITKGGFVVGGKPYTNLKVARTAFADELSGALGYGSATDMSREMGFNMADDSLPPDKFADAIQSIVVPFVERKKASILGGMGEYGKPGRSPASTPPASSGRFSVTDPNGKVHPFDTQAQADAFKKLAGIQ